MGQLLKIAFAKNAAPGSFGRLFKDVMNSIPFSNPRP